MLSLWHNCALGQVMLDVQVRPGSEISIPLHPSFGTLIYVLEVNCYLLFEKHFFWFNIKPSDLLQAILCFLQRQASTAHWMWVCNWTGMSLTVYCVYMQGVGIFEPNRFQEDTTPFYQNEGHGLYIPPSPTTSSTIAEAVRIRTHEWSHLRFILLGAQVAWRDMAPRLTTGLYVPYILVWLGTSLPKANLHSLSLSSS